MALDPDSILQAASLHLECRGDGFSMRALAKELKVDPMALYHYFPSRSILLAAVVDDRFKALSTRKARILGGKGPTERIIRLARTYLSCIQPAPALIRGLASGRVPASTVAATFRQLLELAAQGLELDPDVLESLNQLLVDYLHGFALGGPRPPRTALDRGVALAVAGALRLAHQARFSTSATQRSIPTKTSLRRASSNM